MNKKGKNIEQLFSESFNDFRLEPPSGLWKKISSKLAWRNFFTFNPSTFNAYYLSAILAVTTAGALLITKPVSDNNHEIKEISINKTEESQKSEVSTLHPASASVVITKAENQEPESGIINPATSTQQPATSTKKPNSSIKKTAIRHPEPGTQNLSLSTEVLTKEDSSAIVTTKPENQESISSIKHISPSIQNPEPSTHELATPHPKPTQHPVPSTQHQAPSTDLPDPWPNIDSLFTNQTPTPPQHTIQFPNAFTPNANGPTNGYYTPGIPNNDVFHPEYKGVTEYHLSIFNRRGELIFESKDINTGWDGYINDRLAAQGVYVWKARGKYSNGENFVKFGNIMLIKK